MNPKNKRRGKARPRVARKPRAPKVSKDVKKYVKATIHKNIENKCVQYSQTYAFGGNPVTYPTLSYRRLTPGATSYSIVQGLGQGDRIANKIRVMKVMFRYILLPISYDLILNPTPKPQEIQLYFCNLKGNQRTDPAAGTVGLLYQNGNSFAGPTGLLGDMIRPTNSDVWNIKKRVTHKVGYASAEGTGSQVGSQYFSNNDFKYNVKRSIDITSMFPKIINWSEDSITNPYSNALYLLAYSVNADNTSQLTDTSPAGITFWLDLTYEDA